MDFNAHYLDKDERREHDRSRIQWTGTNLPEPSRTDSNKGDAKFIKFILFAKLASLRS